MRNIRIPQVFTLIRHNKITLTQTQSVNIKNGTIGIKEKCESVNSHPNDRLSTARKVDKKTAHTFGCICNEYIYTKPKENRLCSSNFTDEVSRFIIMEQS